MMAKKGAQSSAALFRAGAAVRGDVMRLPTCVEHVNRSYSCYFAPKITLVAEVYREMWSVAPMHARASLENARFSDANRRMLGHPCSACRLPVLNADILHPPRRWQGDAALGPARAPSHVPLYVGRCEGVCMSTEQAARGSS